MEKSTNSETLKVLESNFLKVFKDNNPFKDAFTDDIQAKLLLFPTDGYYLHEEQFNILVQVISHIGEDKFFISEIECDCFFASLSNESYEYGHWIGEISSSYEDYTNIPLVLENAIYSSSGSWGVIISHEGNAVLGGNKELIKRIQMLYPQYETCNQRFIEYWEHNQREYNSNIDWVPGFLKQFS